MAADDSISTEEVLANFLAANEIKGLDFSLDSKSVEESIKKTLANFRSLPLGKLITHIKDPVRRKNIVDHRWFVREVPLKYIGGYPHIGDLPKEWCQLSIVDTARSIQAHRIRCFFSKSVRRIHGIKKHVDLITKYLHPIILSGGEIRLNKDFLFFPYDSDDGNHRLLACALAKKESVTAYVGLP